jgi:hypothetical protein
MMLKEAFEVLVDTQASTQTQSNGFSKQSPMKDSGYNVVARFCELMAYALIHGWATEAC